MLTEALQHLESLFRRGLPEPMTVEGRPYVRDSKGLEELMEPTAPSVSVRTLGGLVGYCLDNHDKLERDNAFVLVDGPDRVAVYSDVFGAHQQRAARVLAAAYLPDNMVGKWLEQEAFIIGLQSRFTDAGDRAAVLSVAGNITAERAANLSDDGITQQVVVKAGVSIVKSVALPNPVKLAPYRSFAEVEQVLSPFVFRIKRAQHDDDEPARFMVEECDGGAWKLEAHQRLVAYLQNKLPNWRVIG